MPEPEAAAHVACEVVIDGITDDAQSYRDTLYVLADGPGVDVEAELRRLCHARGLSLTELAFAPDEMWDGCALTPAHLDREAFLAAVDVLPAVHEAFSCPTVWIDLHDPAWGDCGGWA